jgi:hypothetical protein
MKASHGRRAAEHANLHEYFLGVTPWREIMAGAEKGVKL